MESNCDTMNTFDGMINRVHVKLEVESPDEPCDLIINDMDSLNAALLEYNKHTGGKSLRVKISNELRETIDSNWRLEGTGARKHVERLMAKRDFWYRAMEAFAVVTAILIIIAILFHKPSHSNNWILGILACSGASTLASHIRSNCMASRIRAITEAE